MTAKKRYWGVQLTLGGWLVRRMVWHRPTATSPKGYPVWQQAEGSPFSSQSEARAVALELNRSRARAQPGSAAA